MYTITALEHCKFIKGQHSIAWNSFQTKDQGTVGSTALIMGKPWVSIKQRGKKMQKLVPIQSKRYWWSEEKGDISTLNPMARWNTRHIQHALLVFAECISSPRNVNSFSGWQVGRFNSLSKLPSATCRQWQWCSSCYPPLGHVNSKEARSISKLKPVWHKVIFKGCSNGYSKKDWLGFSVPLNRPERLHHNFPMMFTLAKSVVLVGTFFFYMTIVSSLWASGHLKELSNSKHLHTIYYLFTAKHV